MCWVTGTATRDELDIDDLRERSTDTAHIDLVYENLEKGPGNALRALEPVEPGREPCARVLAIEDFEAFVSGQLACRSA